MHLSLWRSLSLVFSIFLLWTSSGWSQEVQDLQVEVIAGQGAIQNIIRQRVTEPLVQVTDAQGNPVAGATVVFRCPASGPSATFVDRTRTLTVKTNQQGQARALGLQPNTQVGSYIIEVTASHQGSRATASIFQTNSATPQPSAKKKGFPWRIFAAAAAGAGVGILVAIQTREDSSSSSTPSTGALGTMNLGLPR